MKKQTKFIFDLDGTVTSEETLPLIAKHFHIQDEIESYPLKSLQPVSDYVIFNENALCRFFVVG